MSSKRSRQVPSPQKWLCPADNLSPRVDGACIEFRVLGHVTDPRPDAKGSKLPHRLLYLALLDHVGNLGKLKVAKESSGGQKLAPNGEVAHGRCFRVEDIAVELDGKPQPGYQKLYFVSSGDDVRAIDQLPEVVPLLDRASLTQVFESHVNKGALHHVEIEVHGVSSFTYRGDKTGYKLHCRRDDDGSDFSVTMWNPTAGEELEALQECLDSETDQVHCLVTFVRADISSQYGNNLKSSPKTTIHVLPAAGAAGSITPKIRASIAPTQTGELTIKALATIPICEQCRSDDLTRCGESTYRCQKHKKAGHIMERFGVASFIRDGKYEVAINDIRVDLDGAFVESSLQVPQAFRGVATIEASEGTCKNKLRNFQVKESGQPEPKKKSQKTDESLEPIDDGEPGSSKMRRKDSPSPKATRRVAQDPVKANPKGKGSARLARNQVISDSDEASGSDDNRVSYDRSFPKPSGEIKTTSDDDLPTPPGGDKDDDIMYESD